MLGDGAMEGGSEKVNRVRKFSLIVLLIRTPLQLCAQDRRRMLNLIYLPSSIPEWNVKNFPPNMCLPGCYYYYITTLNLQRAWDNLPCRVTHRWKAPCGPPKDARQCDKTASAPTSLSKSCVPTTITQKNKPPILLCRRVFKISLFGLRCGFGPFNCQDVTSPKSFH